MSFKQIAKGRKTRELMDLITQHVQENERKYGPATYACHLCQDTGFELFKKPATATGRGVGRRGEALGYDATYSRPCANCTAGTRVAAAWDKWPTGGKASAEIPWRDRQNKTRAAARITEILGEYEQEDDPDPEEEIPF